MNLRVCALSRTAVLATATFLAASLPAYALSEAAFQRAAANAFAEPIATYDIPGLVVAATINGTHYVYSYGNASLDPARPVDAKTIFELGSVSKIFTATLAALAADRGLVSLSAATSVYIPQLKGSAFDNITLYDLATHTNGGLPLAVPEDVQGMPGLLRYLAQWKPSAPIATTRKYSNISAGLLGYIAGQKFGGDYAKAVQDQIFVPAGLKDTYLNVPASAEARYAYGYERHTNKPIRVNPGVLDAEAYGVKSTPNDMVRFLDAELGTITVPAQIAKAIEQTHRGLFKTEDFTQDMIWEQYPWPVGLAQLEAGNSNDMILKSQPVERLPKPLAPQRNVLLSKTGSTNGFGAYVVLLPGQKAGIIVLANRNYSNAARIRATYRLLQSLDLQN